MQWAKIVLHVLPMLGFTGRMKALKKLNDLRGQAPP